MKSFISTIFLLATMLIISCSNDNVVDNTANKVNAAKDIKFEISFSDYNTNDTISHGTRAAIGSQIQKTQIVPMGEMMYAEVSLQRDTTKTIDKVGKAKTRALTDGTYTIYAYHKSRKTKCDAVIKRNANFLCKTKCDNIECTHRRKSQTLDFPV